MLESSKYVHSFTDVIDWDGMGKIGLTYQYYFSYNQTKLNTNWFAYFLKLLRYDCTFTVGIPTVKVDPNGKGRILP